MILPEAQVDQLFGEMYAEEAYQLNVDLEGKQVVTPAGEKMAFDLDEFRRHCLLHGLDDIGLTLQDSEAIKNYEQQRRQQAPWLFGTS